MSDLGQNKSSTRGFLPCYPLGMGRLFALILAFGLALAQGPEAELREALLRTFGSGWGAYASLDQAVYLTPEGKEAEVLFTWTYADPGACRLRLEVAPSQEAPRAVLVYTPERQFLRTPEGQTLPLDDRLLLELLFTWQTGPLGVGFPYTRVEREGEVDLPDGGRALAYRVERREHRCLPKGVLEASPFVGRIYLQEGRVVGEGYFSPVLGAEALVLYRELREVDGVRYPVRLETWALVEGKGVPFARGVNLEFRAGPALGEELFR